MTLEALITLTRLRQPAKTLCPKLVTLDGIVIEGSAVQKLNAKAPMLVTVVGIVTEVSLAQRWKAYAGIAVTVVGTTTTALQPYGYEAVGAKVVGATVGAGLDTFNTTKISVHTKERQ